VSKRARVLPVAIVVVALLAGAGGWYAYERTGPRDATAAGRRLRADVQTLLSELGLQEPTPDLLDDLGADGEECGIWDGSGRRLSQEARRAHRLVYNALPPDGRQVTDLEEEAEAVLRGRGYRIITEEVNSYREMPPGTVFAEWGWGNVLEISLHPDPQQGTMRVTGSAPCLPLR